MVGTHLGVIRTVMQTLLRPADIHPERKEAMYFELTEPFDVATEEQLEELCYSIQMVLKYKDQEKAEEAINKWKLKKSST